MMRICWLASINHIGKRWHRESEALLRSVYDKIKMFSYITNIILSSINELVNSEEHFPRYYARSVYFIRQNSVLCVILTYLREFSNASLNHCLRRRYCLRH